MKFELKQIILLAFLAYLMPFIACGQSALDSLEEQYKRLKDTASRGPILKQLSRAAFENYDYSSAIYYLQKELQLHTKTKDSVSWANANYSLGMVYTVTQNLQGAEQHSNIALRYFQEHTMLVPLANTCINLGYIYNELKDTDKSFAAYNRALTVFKNLMTQQELDASYYNLGLLGRNYGNLNSYRKIYEENLGMANRLNSTSLSLVYSSLGVLCLKQNDIDKAEKYIYDGLKISVKYNDLNSIANGQILIGKVLTAQGKKKEAYRMTELGLNSAKSAKNRPLVLEAYSELARIAMSMKKPAAAYTYLDSYIQLKDSVFNEQLSMQYSRANKRFEIMDDNMDPGTLLKENLDQSNTLQKDSSLKIVLYIAISVVLLLLLIFLIRYYAKARIARELSEQTRIIEEQKGNLEDLIQTKDRFMSIIAHDLKNPFNSLLGYADLAYNDFEKITDSEKKSYLSVIRQSGQQIYSLLDNLLSWSRTQSGRIDFFPEPVSLMETIENVVDLVRGSADNKQITIFSDFTRDVVVKADRNMLLTVMRNLLTNAIKFTPNGGSVTVSSRIGQKKVTVSVTDTGIGMSEEDLEKLFRLDGGLKKSGTANEVGTGLGLILCQEFLGMHKSKIVAESVPDKGSTFSFTLDFIQQF